jgi:TRAP-type mannitol/chloroaromatic compound transport system permease small subunit
MPTIDFVLPHWMYWLGLIFIPLMAMYIVRKQRGKEVDGGVTKPIAYLFLVSAGFVGIHRLYLKNALGLVYIPVFILLLISNFQVRQSNNLVSKAREVMSIVDFDLERAQKTVKKTQAELAEAKTSTDPSVDKAELEKDIKAAQDKLKKAEQEMAAGIVQHAAAQGRHDRWFMFTSIIAVALLLMMLYDAFKLPGLVAACAAKEAGDAGSDIEKPRMPEHEPGTGGAPQIQIENKFFHAIDKINGYVGEFVCFWAIIAVFVYYYEVLARYMFNSPTNWAHEGMFLMFGMQYVLAAGFTNRDDAHVRVDVIYKFFPERLKGLTDVFTSIFFFIFAFALLWTGWVFAFDSMSVWEVSFTEWAIQYWPVKLALPLGAVLLTLDGITRLIKDIYVLAGKRV